jgi:hypothetical protein
VARLVRNLVRKNPGGASAATCGPFRIPIHVIAGHIAGCLRSRYRGGVPVVGKTIGKLIGKKIIRAPGYCSITPLES